MTAFKKEDHLEVSEGPTKIVSSANCPLTKAERKQLFRNNDNEDVICCFICYEDGSEGRDFCCPCFYGAFYSKSKGFQVACRMDVFTYDGDDDENYTIFDGEGNPHLEVFADEEEAVRILDLLNEAEAKRIEKIIKKNT